MVCPKLGIRPSGEGARQLLRRRARRYEPRDPLTVRRSSGRGGDGAHRPERWRLAVRRAATGLSPRAVAPVGAPRSRARSEARGSTRRPPRRGSKGIDRSARPPRVRRAGGLASSASRSDGEANERVPVVAPSSSHRRSRARTTPPARPRGSNEPATAAAADRTTAWVVRRSLRLECGRSAQQNF